MSEEPNFADAHKAKCKRRLALLDPIQIKCRHLHLVCDVCHPCTCASILEDQEWKFCAIAPFHYAFGCTVDEAVAKARAGTPRRLRKNKRAMRVKVYRVHPETSLGACMMNMTTISGRMVPETQWSFPGEYAPVELMEENFRVNADFK